MSISVKPNHPLKELLAKLLFGIETVPMAEQRRMVNRACREAVEWHELQKCKWIAERAKDGL